MLTLSRTQVRRFQNTILKYYREQGRALPWRKNIAPYRVLVSEIMLQQTQVSRVLQKYPEFLRAFPSFQTLSRAPLSRVLRVWQGMGYNRRAIALKKIAVKVMKEYDGKLPLDPTILETFPGIGHYTARAIACFSGGPCEPFIETNIRRVLIHFFFPRSRTISDEPLLTLLERVQPLKQRSEWYNALMDYGVKLSKEVTNPNRRSASYRKQSAFKGSVREMRGKILALLLDKQGLTKHAILQHLQDRARIVPAIVQLEKEGFIKLWQNKYRIVR